MAITTKNFDELVTEQRIALQGSSSSLLDLSVGSVLRAFLEANAAVALWLQGLVLQSLQYARASTATAADLDSWVADFGLVRLDATRATGDVTFSRSTTTTGSPQLFIPVGTVVKNAASGVQFEVVASGLTYDALVAAGKFDAALNGYYLTAGQSSVNLPVQAQVAGTTGNVAAGAVDSFLGTLNGVATVTNASGFVNAVDGETDEALRTRFQTHIAGLSRATKTAVGAALGGVQAGMDYQIVENLNYDDTANPGYFYAVVDDGSGSTPATTVSAASAAIELVRPLGVTFGVFAAVPQTINVTMTVKGAAGTSSILQAQVTAAVQKFLNELKIGEDVSFTKLADTVYNASTFVENVTAINLAGSTAATDVVISVKQKAVAGTVTVTVV